MTRSSESNLPPALLAQIDKELTARIGLHFAPERWSELQSGLDRACRELGFASLEQGVQQLLAHGLSQPQIEAIASHLTIGETYFFRDARSFEVLREHILRPLIQARHGKEQHLRIWSAACSTGEEPYSLAMVLHEMIPRLQDWRITLLATDINLPALDKARRGIYRDWSFRAAPAHLKERFFNSLDGGQYEVIEPVRRLVKFAYLNLAEDIFPSLLNDTNAMDVILCRNVLMYFAPAQAQTVVHNLYRCLIDEGCLLTSANEGPSVRYTDFHTLNFPGVIVYQRSARGLPIRATKPVPPVAPKRPATTPASPSRPAPTPPSPAASPPPLQSATPPAATSQSVAPAQPLESLATILDKAQRDYEDGRYKEAIAQLESASGNDTGPEAARVDTLRARAYANEGNLERALHWSERAIQSNKLDAGCYYLHATILQEQGAMAEAAAALRRALYLDPNFVLAHFALGNLAREGGRREEAMRAFGNAQRLARQLATDQVLPESEGITAGRLADIVSTMIDNGV